ncbi:recombinase family protein [Dankookia sp. P2]|uniref:recombinase family protein n=1 Tax=Dankookia sp. P2 TaxID=3423955 RepID=UPI003D669BE3
MGGKVPLGYDIRNRKLVPNPEEAERVRRMFEVFVETGSGAETVRRLRAEGATSKSGRPLDKGDVYKLLNNRTYIGAAAHRGQVYPGEHEAIVPRDLWDRAHAILQVSPRTRAARNRQRARAAEGADFRGGRTSIIADALREERPAFTGTTWPSGS